MTFGLPCLTNFMKGYEFKIKTMNCQIVAYVAQHQLSRRESCWSIDRIMPYIRVSVNIAGKRMYEWLHTNRYRIISSVIGDGCVFPSERCAVSYFVIYKNIRYFPSTLLIPLISIFPYNSVSQERFS